MRPPIPIPHAEQSRDHIQVLTENDHAPVALFPPLLPLGALAAGIFLEWIYPLSHRLPALSSPVRWMASGLLFAFGAALMIGSGRALRRAHTALNPRYPTTALVVDWPFSLTRNPIYLGGNFVYLAVALAIPLDWALALFPVAVVLCHYLVVLREENYLGHKFGQEYRAYHARVRRWL